MESTTSETKKIPLGVKAIASLFIIFFILGAMGLFFRLTRPDQLQSGANIVVVEIVVGGLFLTLGIGLFKKKNWARIGTIILFAFIFLLILGFLVMKQIFPNPIHWWHFYLYPILIIYLLRVKGAAKQNTGPGPEGTH